MAEHGLRDLARKILETAQRHPHYNQGAKIVDACYDHLCAAARTHEANAKIEELRKKLRDLEAKDAQV